MKLPWVMTRSPSFNPLKNAYLTVHIFAHLHCLNSESIRSHANKDNILTIHLLNGLLRDKNSGNALARGELRARQHLRAKAIIWVSDLDPHLHEPRYRIELLTQVRDLSDI